MTLEHTVGNISGSQKVLKISVFSKNYVSVFVLNRWPVSYACQALTNIETSSWAQPIIKNIMLIIMQSIT